MNQITTALTPVQIAAIEAKQTPAAQADPQPAPSAAPQQTSVAFATGEGRTKVVPLQWPIMVDGQKIDAITLRRLTGRDYKTLGALPTGADENGELLALMAGLPTSTFDALDADDFEEVSRQAKDFLPHGLRQAIEQASTTGAASQR